MSSPVHTVEPGAPVEDAAATMTEQAVTALPVVDRTGRLVGIVSEGDLLWRRVPTDPTAQLNRLPTAAPAGRPSRVDEVMSASPITTRPGADLAEVAEAMLMYDVRSMPVIDDDTLVGIISRRDILRAMVRTDDTLTREVQHRLDEYAAGRWTATVEEGVAVVAGPSADTVEREIVVVLARTVPGVAAARVEQSAGS